MTQTNVADGPGALASLAAVALSSCLYFGSGVDLVVFVSGFSCDFVSIHLPWAETAELPLLSPVTRSVFESFSQEPRKLAVFVDEMFCTLSRRVCFCGQTFPPRATHFCNHPVCSSTTFFYRVDIGLAP